MKIKSSKILVIGDVMIDKYIIGKHNRDSPEADCAILNYVNTEDRLGGAANVAFNLSKLNQNVTLISVTGDDEGAISMNELCKANKINFVNIKDTKRPTTIKTRYVNESYKQYLRLDQEKATHLNLDIESKLITQISEISKKGIELIIVQDYNKGVITKNIIESIQSICNENDIKLSVDPKYDNFQILSNCDLFKPNLKELEHQYGHRIKADKNGINTALKELGLKSSTTIFVTLADKGIYYQKGNNYGIIEGIAITNADVSGAGDTVISSLSILLLQGISIIDMAAISNKCGAYVCKKQGVYFVENVDFQSFIDQIITHK